MGTTVFIEVEFYNENYEVDKEKATQWVKDQIDGHAEIDLVSFSVETYSEDE